MFLTGKPKGDLICSIRNARAKWIVLKLLLDLIRKILITDAIDRTQCVGVKEQCLLLSPSVCDLNLCYRPAGTQNVQDMRDTDRRDPFLVEVAQRQRGRFGSLFDNPRTIRVVSEARWDAASCD